MRSRFAAVALASVLLIGTSLSSPVSGWHGTAASAATALPRVSFAAMPGSSILVHGTYPKVHSSCRAPVQPLLHARYSGRIEVGKDTDGSLFVIGELPVEEYLKGIAEVPRLWPTEALKAQAVAARSYALAHLRYGDPTGARLGYQLCATDACQVYLGLGIAAGPYGDRWSRAVDHTAGQVLLTGGRPADALYFSTSNGHTWGNESAFGTDPLPYLRPVKERDDGASPLSHWQVLMPLSDLARFLGAAGVWPGGAITSVARDGSNVVLSRGGVSRTVDVVSFRSDLNYWAYCLDPGSYPGLNAVNQVRLPQTIPSKWFDLSVRSGSMDLEGRGWGHGVGMVQWGAEGKAARGMSYDDILAYYYGGLRPQTGAEPSTIRVGIATGLRSVTVEPTGQVTVEGRRAPGLGPWLITGGQKLLIRRGSPPPSFIRAGTLRGPSTASSGRRFRATVSLPQLSVVHLALRAGGEELSFSRAVTRQEGSATLVGRVPAVPSGTYRVRAVVTNGIDIVRTKGIRVRIAGVAATPSPSISPSHVPPPRALPAVPTSGAGALPIAIGVAAVLVAAGAVVIRRRRRPKVRPATAPPPSDLGFGREAREG